MEIDVIARRYGKLPTELTNLSMSGFDFVRLCTFVGLEEEKRQMEKELREMKRKHGRN